MNTEKLTELLSFIRDEIEPATTELEKIEDDSRKHLQKLVYTNLVDRFDYAIDQTLLSNCREDALVEEAAKSFEDTISEAELVRLLLNADTIQDALEKKLRSGLRSTILRERHSKKLRMVYSLLSDCKDADYWSVPRVNISTGRILTKIKPTNKKMPYSICGYADWLYSRRNTVVHGGASGNIGANDLKQLKTLFKCEPAKAVVIRLATVTNTANFYKDVVAELTT